MKVKHWNKYSKNDFSSKKYKEIGVQRESACVSKHSPNDYNLLRCFILQLDKSDNTALSCN